MMPIMAITLRSTCTAINKQRSDADGWQRRQGRYGEGSIAM